MRPFRRTVAMSLAGVRRPPPELSEYQIAKAFWKNLGVPASAAPLDMWPDVLVRRYADIMRAEVKQAELDQERASRKAEAEARAKRGR